jgi:hypothetical protein
MKILYPNRCFKASNVLFVNGSEDPWHRLSVLSDKSPQEGGARSILIEGKHDYMPPVVHNLTKAP